MNEHAVGANHEFSQSVAIPVGAIHESSRSVGAIPVGAIHELPLHAKHQPYPAHKPSGVAWLGDIPAHWEVKRFRYTVDGCQNGLWGDEPIGNEDDIICIRVADFDRTRSRVNDTRFTLRSIPASQRHGQEIQSGDLLLEKSGGGELQPVGKVVLYDLPYPAVSSNFVARMRPLENYDARFLTYLHDAAYAGRLNVFSIKQNTGIQNLDSSSYLNEQAGFPPLPEQRAIATYLDREMARLDALVSRKERLIKLLQEKRTALISRAVTQGLDPDASMKDSCVEWLGDIPAHWEVWKLSHTFKRIGSGTTPATNDFSFYDGDIPWVTTSELRENVITDTTTKLTERAFKEHSALTMYPPGTLLIAMYGATIGRLAILGISACTNQACCAFAEPIVLDPKFAFYWLWARRLELIAASSGGGQPNINQDKLRDLRIPVPPLPEQRAIAAYLDGETAKIDALVAKVRQAIETLKEYRTALISAAVMGKMDVRDT